MVRGEGGGGTHKQIKCWGQGFRTQKKTNNHTLLTLVVRLRQRSRKKCTTNSVEDSLCVSRTNRRCNGDRHYSYNPLFPSVPTDSTDITVGNRPYSPCTIRISPVRASRQYRLCCSGDQHHLHYWIIPLVPTDSTGILVGNRRYSIGAIERRSVPAGNNGAAVEVTSTTPSTGCSHHGCQPIPQAL